MNSSTVCVKSLKDPLKKKKKCLKWHFYFIVLPFDELSSTQPKTALSLQLMLPP